MFQVIKALNYISNYIFENNCLNQSKINKDTYYYLRETYGLKSQMAQSVMKTAIARYKTNKSNKHEFNLVKFKNLEYDLVWNRDYSLIKGMFSINSLNGRQVKSKRGNYKILRKQLQERGTKSAKRKIKSIGSR